MQTQTQYQSELKVIGDRIESLAKQLKADGDIPHSEALYKLGNEVEHFFEQTDAVSEATAASQSVVDTDFPVS